MWIDKDAKEDCLRVWIKHCSAMKFVTDKNGKFLWANTAFCEWSQYTNHELYKMNICDIEESEDNDAMNAGVTDGYYPIYTMKTQLTSKGNPAAWGSLSSVRYPLVGEVECVLWTWEPLRDGSSAAFKQAMDSNEKVEKRIAEMTEVLKVITTQTDEDRWVIGTIRLIQKYPKVALAIVFMVAGLLGLNNVLEILQRTGVIEIPIRVEPKAEDGSAGLVDPKNTMVRMY